MEEVPKGPGGRPTKYKPEYCALLVGHMKIGMTYTSFAGHPAVLVNVDTLYQWEKDYPEFSEAKGIGRSVSEYFFMEAGLAGLFDKSSLNSPHWANFMKNMHGWKDKVETTIEAGKTITMNYSLEGKK